MKGECKSLHVLEDAVPEIRLGSIRQAEGEPPPPPDAERLDEPDRQEQPDQRAQQFSPSAADRPVDDDLLHVRHDHHHGHPHQRTGDAQAGVPAVVLEQAEHQRKPASRRRVVQGSGLPVRTVCHGATSKPNVACSQSMAEAAAATRCVAIPIERAVLRFSPKSSSIATRLASHPIRSSVRR